MMGARLRSKGVTVRGGGGGDLVSIMPGLLPVCVCPKVKEMGLFSGFK